MQNLNVRVLENSDYPICQQIVKNQQLIWDIPAADVVPFWKLMTLPSTGGVLIGAFAAEKIVGHAMLTPAVDPRAKEPFFYLDMIGVLPAYRNNGLAERMLRLAGEVAQEQNVSSIQWTFDPLEMANANLYIRKLGAQAIRFYPDYYGPPADADGHFRTDRFWVTWEGRMRPLDSYVQLPPTILTLDQPTKLPDAESVAIALPDDFRRLSAVHPERAAQIRKNSAHLFTQLFQHEFVIAGFSHSKNYYIAQKEMADS